MSKIYKISVKARGEIQTQAIAVNSAHAELMGTLQGQDFAAVSNVFSNLVKPEIENGATREDLDSVFNGKKISTDSQAYAIVSRLITNHNAKLGKVGKTGGGGGSKKQKAKTAKTKKVAKKVAKTLKGKTISEITIATAVQTLEQNLKSKFAESEVDYTRKNVTTAELAQVTKDVASVFGQVKNNPALITDALPKAKAAVKIDKMPPAQATRNNTKKVLASTKK